MSAGFKRSGAKSRGKSHLVVTGKRVKGTWMMESRLALSRRHSSKGSAQTAMAAENRRVRTLH